MPLCRPLVHYDGGMNTPSIRTDRKLPAIPSFDLVSRLPLLLFALMAAFDGLVVQRQVGADQDAERLKVGRLDFEDTGYEIHIIDPGVGPVATYTPDSNGRPVWSALYSPGGNRLTRGYPMLPAVAPEKKDHPHHRGLWFGHGEVNDVDFWADVHNDGRIEQTEIKVDRTDADQPRVRTANQWFDPDGNPVCSDQREFTFTRHDDDTYVMDVTVHWRAGDSPVHLGDTKEGLFGLRVSGLIKEDANLGGRIQTAEGLSGTEAWGRHAAWADYTGPIHSSPASPRHGVTILDHPDNFNQPPRWHIRTYGLMAANPRGEKHFTGQPGEGGNVIHPGETLTFKYRLLLHAGDLDRPQTETFMKDWSGQK